MPTDFFDIHQALLFVYTSGNFSIPTEYENADLEELNQAKQVGDPWARFTVIPSDVNIATMGRNGQDEHVGILSIELFYPKGNGAGDIIRKADEIRSVFQANVYGSSGGASKIYILSCNRSGGTTVDGWYKLDLTVEWMARTNRV